jgi:hypothetical protein
MSAPRWLRRLPVPLRWLAVAVLFPVALLLDLCRGDRP